MMTPLYIPLVVEPTRRLATSALPDAPVVPDNPRRRAGTRATPARRATAGLLRQLADRVEPRPVLGC